MSIELNRIRDAAERAARSTGVEVVDVEWKVGKQRFLRVFIDKPDGVSHRDCQAVSEQLGVLLDLEDLVPGSRYVLEVSSPGLERKLRGAADYTRFQGSLVKLQTFTPVENNRHFTGRLTAFDGQRLTLDLSAVKQKGKAKKTLTSQSVTIDLANVEKASLVAEI